MNSLELVKIHEATERRVNASEFLIKFASIMERIENLKYTVPLLHRYSEKQIDIMIENCETYVTKFSGKFKSDKKYEPFAEFLEDYFLSSSIEAKNVWEENKK